MWWNGQATGLARSRMLVAILAAKGTYLTTLFSGRTHIVQAVVEWGRRRRRPVESSGSCEPLPRSVTRGPPPRTLLSIVAFPIATVACRQIRPMAPVTNPSNRSTAKAPLLGPVLVTGGCGFLGYHLVDRLLADPDCAGPVHVLDVTVARNRHDNHPSGKHITYIKGSLTDEPLVSSLVHEHKYVVIFHTASPNASYAASRSDFYKVNVDGTKLLLRLSKQSPHVRAVVYTSSIDVYADPPHRHIKESHPLWPEKPWPWAGVSEYDRTKAIAHRLVLAANTPADTNQQGSLKTAVIVSAHLWGIRCSQGLSVLFDTFSDPKKPLWQVGPGENQISAVEVGNCARAHILAAKALLSPEDPLTGGKVDGEAFNVTDGQDVNFWANTRDVCELIRKQDQGRGGMTFIQVLPAWLMVCVAGVVRWLLLIFTLGYQEPPIMLCRNSVSWCLEDHTLDDSKARERLGYKEDLGGRTKREILAEAVEWERERRSSAKSADSRKKETIM